MRYSYTIYVRGTVNGQLRTEPVVWDSDDSRETVESVQREIDPRMHMYEEIFGLQGPLTVTKIENNF